MRKILLTIGILMCLNSYSQAQIYCLNSAKEKDKTIIVEPNNNIIDTKPIVYKETFRRKLTSFIRKTIHHRNIFTKIYCNPNIIVESYTSKTRDITKINKDRDYDILSDGIEYSIHNNCYYLYLPKLKTLYIVKSNNKNFILGEHLVWMIKMYRTHKRKDFFPQ